MFSNIKITEPIFLRNLFLYPICGESEDGFKLSTIDEVLSAGKGAFRELDTPDINEIIFENNNHWPALMLDGEEITGSLQNRISTVSNIVEARSSRHLPVVCVEEGRWNEIGGFQTGHCSYPKIRTILAKSRKKIDTQNSIWKEITRKISSSKTISTTSSMHDIFNNLQAEIDRYMEDFHGLNHKTVGFIGVVGKQILGSDIFFNPEIYKKFEKKLLRSYVLDAIEHQKTQEGKFDVENFLSDVLMVLSQKRITFTSKNIKVKGHGFSGQALIYKNRPLHVSIFPT